MIPRFDDAVRIGLSRSITGGFSAFDTPGANGLKIAVGEINAMGGIDGCPLEFLAGDTQANPALARQIAEDLIRIDVVFINDYLPRADTIVRHLLRATGVTLPIVAETNFPSNALPEVVATEGLQEVCDLTSAFRSALPNLPQWLVGIELGQVQNFAARAGCSVTVSAVMRREWRQGTSHPYRFKKAAPRG